MKKFIIVLIVILLTACSGPAKTPTQVPQAAPLASDTPVPTDIPAATVTDTAVPAATDTEAPAASSASAANSFGDIVFTNRVSGKTVTGTGGFSVAAFANSCSNVPSDVTLTITTTNTDIYKVNYAYRLTAMDAPTITSGWSGDAKMTAGAPGTFSFDFQSTLVRGDWRARKAWLDLQFIAFDNSDLTYTSPLLTRLITFNNCP